MWTSLFEISGVSVSVDSDEICSFRKMGTLSGTATLPFSFLPPVSEVVNSKRKEFAPEEQILSFKSRFH